MKVYSRNRKKRVIKRKEFKKSNICISNHTIDRLKERTDITSEEIFYNMLKFYPIFYIGDEYYRVDDIVFVAERSHFKNDNTIYIKTVLGSIENIPWLVEISYIKKTYGKLYL